MITLYQRESCPHCKPVRQLLTDLGVTYVNANVVKPREERHELIAATGAHFIPALVDGDIVVQGKLENNAAVLAYLTDKFGDPEAPSRQGC